MIFSAKRRSISLNFASVPPKLRIGMSVKITLLVSRRNGYIADWQTKRSIDRMLSDLCNTSVRLPTLKVIQSTGGGRR